jgi:hypothetical protein
MSVAQEKRLHDSGGQNDNPLSRLSLLVRLACEPVPATLPFLEPSRDPLAQTPVRPARPRSAGCRLHCLAHAGRDLEFAATQDANAPHIDYIAQVEVAPLVVRAQCLASRGAPAVPQDGRRLISGWYPRSLNREAQSVSRHGRARPGQPSRRRAGQDGRVSPGHDVVHVLRCNDRGYFSCARLPPAARAGLPVFAPASAGSR